MLETKSIAALAFEETPRKRKRETLYKNAPPPPSAQQQPPEKDAQDAAVVASTESCFTNAAFSSTPKKLMVARRRLAKENSHPNPFPGLEVKSIADLAQQQQHQQQQLSTNPFEVLRQPPKKKKREHACFENPGLNLELPEKQFNPYEVVRLAATPAKGFVNPALNLRGSDAPASLNPFEIHRPSEASEAACNPAGVANLALADREPDEQLPTSLKIGLPFTPTLGCRIDFHGMSLTQLTPSKLLAEKLVFSPVPVAVAAPKRSLGAISEESSMDIGKELDRYQLELENSINEAKLRKNGHQQVDREVPRNSLEVELPKNTKLVMETDTQALMMQEVGDTQVERRLVCTRRRTLTEISEAPEEDKEDKEELLEKDAEAEEIREQERMLEQEMLLERERHSTREQQLEQEKLLERQRHLEREKLQEKLHEQLREKLQERAKHLEQEKLEEERLERQLQEEREKEPADGDVAYASESESDDEPDDLDFKAPTRFVRAYRPAALPTKAASKESLHSIASSKSAKSAEVKPSGGMKGMIRKSIRRLMHPTAHTSPEKCEDKDGHGQGHTHHNILNSIRHSLRRRPQKAAELEEQLEPVLADVSIVDTSERTMKLRSSVAQTEYMTIEQLTNEKKHSLRNSIRRSTRDVLRHVFHKSHDAYATAK
ncbi:calponin homology domain-containing protein DDB_G0272472 [Drosophila teissieri]|uniref:calponin homology domain-containing protein DDB_G0272472 n=1 Tax=Drosophila teissieri TaxID=7243 RepID=UPI001CB9E16F|nr:calponin homology domain-containing protein DDB_G0272472 [Drosophila teissieri]